jgi:hypothetical protein
MVRIAVGASLVVALVPGLAFARVMHPIDDEAFFASPAFNLATKALGVK